MVAFGFGVGFGAAASSTRATGPAVLAETLRVFFAAAFLTDFAGLVFEIFAPVLARLRVVRAGRGFAAAVFFGFFMTTILATECGCCWRVRPVFGWRNGYLILVHTERAQSLALTSHSQLSHKIIRSFTERLPQNNAPKWAAICLPTVDSEVDSGWRNELWEPPK
jgi:hypothetical protein